MKKMDAYINMDSFGDNLPWNWQTAAAFLNGLIDGICEDENGEVDRDDLDTIWENYCSGVYNLKIMFEDFGLTAIGNNTVRGWLDAFDMAIDDEGTIIFNGQKTGYSYDEIENASSNF